MTLHNLDAGSDEQSDKFDSLLDGYLWPDSCYDKINCKKAFIRRSAICQLNSRFTDHTGYDEKSDRLERPRLRISGKVRGLYSYTI